MPRGNTPHGGDTRRLPARPASDMLRETCPDDMGQIDAPPPPPPAPSAWVIFAPPLGLCALSVLVAWMHAALGSPFGPEWATKLWGMTEMAIAATVPAVAFGAYARRQNLHAMRVIQAHAATQHPSASASSLPRVRQVTGPNRTLGTGRHRVVVLEEISEDEEAGPW